MRGAVDRIQARPGRQHQQRQQRARGDQCATRAEPVQEQRRSERAEPHGEEEQALHHAEDACDHLLRRGTLQQGHARDVDDRVADADDREQHEREHLVRPDRDERNRNAPDEDAEAEVRSEPTPADEGRRSDSAEQAADADGGIEEADARVPGVEELQRDHHDQDVQHPVDERLRGEQPHEQTQAPLPGDDAETGEQLFGDRARLRRLALLNVCERMDARDENRRPDERCRGDDEDGSGSRRSEQQAADRRPAEDPDAFDRARRHVRRRQLLGCSNEGRNECGLRRAEGCRRDPDEAGDDVDQRGRRVCVDGHRRAPDEGCAHQVGGDHDDPAVVAVAEERREWRGERCGEPARHANDADRRRPSLLVRVDDHGDAVGPGAEERSGPGKLDPAQRRVGENIAERPTGLSQLPQETPHPPQDRSPACVFEEAEGRFSGGRTV